MNYDIKLKFNSLDEKTVAYINSLVGNNNVLIEIPNTKGISSELVKKLDSRVYIRVSGGYNDELIRNLGNVRYSNGETGEYYTSSVIYSKYELFSIIEEMENIEKKIDNKWSDFEKFALIYNELKSNIFYDPKYEVRPSSDTRSLRGLIIKKTVCAGYSMILKELLDRQGIDCEYVQGNGHAWNIVKIDNKNYGIDLTWENSNYRTGNFKSSDYFGQDPVSFARTHKPEGFYKIQNYEKYLSRFDSKDVNKIMSFLDRDEDYTRVVYYGNRSDNTKFLVAQVGSELINGIRYYKYYYCDKLENGNYDNPVIVYSESNIAKLINDRRFKRYYPPGVFDVITDVLFSKDNVNDSLRNGTSYIGKYRKGGRGTNTVLVSDWKDIKKDDNISRLFSVNTDKVVRRSDGSRILISKSDNMFLTPYGYVYRYIIYELLNDKKNKGAYVRKNVIFTEMNLFSDKRQDVFDVFLSRRRLDNAIVKSGGYIGKYDANGEVVYNPDMVNYFKLNGDDILEKKGKVYDPKKFDSSLVSKLSVDFNLLHDCALKYGIVFDRKNGNYLVKDLSNGTIIYDKDIVNKAILANIWLSAAGILVTDMDVRPGEAYAFSDDSRILYEEFFNRMLSDVKKVGTIDTVSLYKYILDKYGKDKARVIVSIFSNTYNTSYINSIFRDLGKVDVEEKNKAVTLYSVSYVDKIIKYDNMEVKIMSDNKRIDKIIKYYNDNVGILSEIDKNIYDKLIKMCDDKECGMKAINLLDGYLHNVVSNKGLVNYFTYKDKDIIDSFKISEGSNLDIINSVTSYNQKLYSINYFAMRAKDSKNKNNIFNEDSKNKEKKEEKKDIEENKDKEKSKGTKKCKRKVVRVKKLSKFLKDKKDEKMNNLKKINLFDKLKKLFDKKEDKKEKKGRKR